MRILYYHWNEFTAEDTIDCMTRLGHELVIFRCPWNLSDQDEHFEGRLEEALREGTATPSFDMVFSWNFFPIISRVCQREGVPYVSWVFDSPHFPLASVDVINDCNRIYLFDRALVDLYREKNVTTVSYAPLGVNSERLRRQMAALDGGSRVYEHEISFVGNLYNNEYNFYDLARELMPDKLGEYLDELMDKQLPYFDRDYLGDDKLLPASMVRELSGYLRIDVSGGRYIFDEDILLRDILKKKVTQLDRAVYLQMLGMEHKVDLYTKHDGPSLDNVCDMGEADYLERMPRIFHRSRINLNIMMRSIRSGMSLRVLDILGAGGFLLSSYTSELAEYFEDGSELVIFRNADELRDKAAYYLKEEESRAAIAQRGCIKALADFDYMKLLPRLLK
ncbi:CgeB family protein [Butyrivibrio sp. MC2013]|uniref:CgeB family protein n=1 Tax=Butyrivibrio sp. MC2013 TaxID=1280686 RepID=UPI00040DE574|nr:DUF3880 domain-containing protein [Butyrivibrio sp. MC2013]